MKNSLVIIAFLFTSLFLHAEQLSDYDAISLRTKWDYTAKVDKTALVAANYLLATPVEKKSVQRLKTAKFYIAG